MRVARLLSLAAVLACGLALPASAAPCAGPAPRIRDAGKRFLVLAEGDSITFGQAASDGQGSYVQRACVLRNSAVETIVAAQSRAILGSPKDAPGANSLYGRMAADNAILAKKDGRTAILTVLVGRNDLVGTWGGPEAYAGNLAAYLAAMRRAGWTRIVVGTELPSTWEPFDPERDTLNLILTAPGWARAHGIDAIADFALSPEMGGDGQAADKTYFADGIHPTNLGYATLASIYGRALTQAMAKR